MANRIVTKVLAGIEDLLLGTGTVTQTRNGVSETITKIDAAGLVYENAETLRTRFGKKVEVLTNVAALQLLATTTAAETFVYLLGYTTAGDGGGGLFWLDTTDTTTVEDLNIVFNPDNTSNGRWKRVDTDDYMSPDRGDADYTIVGFDFGIQQYATALTANRTVTLPTSGLYKGKRVSILRTASGSFNLLVGSITTLTGKGLVELQYDGTTWIVLIEPTNSSSALGDTFNGSFEIDSNNDSQADNWTSAPLSGATIAIDKTDSIHGVNSLKFTSGGNGGGSYVSKRFDVTSSKNINIEFLYKASSATVLTKVDIKTYDRSNVLLSTLSVYSEGVTNPSSYTSIIGNVTADATAVTAEIVLTGIDAASTTKTAGTTTNFDFIRYSLVSTLLTYKTFDIGDWNMDTTTSVNVAHGLVYANIRTISALIRNDADTAVNDFMHRQSVETSNHFMRADATNISLSRSAVSIFDSTTYDSTSYNRGWITVGYII